jgi:chromate transporter
MDASSEDLTLTTPAPSEALTDEVHPRLSLGALAWVFFRIGALAFGETELVMIERELVDRRRVLTHQDLTDALTYTKPLPGSTVVQIVAYLAYRLGGWPGSALATIVYLLPSTLAMMALAAGYIAVSDLPLVRPAAEGLTAAAVGLLLATAWRLSKRSINRRQPLTLVLAAGAIIASGLFHLSAALVVVVAGLVGIAAYTSSEAAASAPQGGRS